MTLDVTIDGKFRTTTKSYSIVEDATPTEPSDTSGGFGQITLNTMPAPDDRNLYGRDILIEDIRYGVNSGIIRQASGSRGITNLTADSRMSLLSVVRRANPFVGTLKDALLYYFSLCGVTSGIVIDEGFEGIEVTFVGWYANVYDQLKKMTAALGFELALASNNIIARPVGTREALRHRDLNSSWSIDATDLAQSVEAYYYSPDYRTNSLCYPPGGWSMEVQPLQVDAGETQEFDLEIFASLLSVQQPTPVESVSPTYQASSVYTVVSMSDGLIVQPAQWTAAGGKVVVEIGEDTRSLKVKVTGANIPELGGFALAMPSGPNDFYSSLRIVGTGVFIDPKLVTRTASLNPDIAPTVVAPTIENEFIDTYARAHNALLWAASRYAHPKRTISVTTKGINRAGDPGKYVYPTVGEIKELFPDYTVADYKAMWDGWTIGEIKAYLREITADRFENQAYGNVAGAMVEDELTRFRIRSATFTPTQISYTAERRVTVGDIKRVRLGATVGQVKELYPDAKVRDYINEPLRTLPELELSIY